jgi:hypothetical protein
LVQLLQHYKKTIQTCSPSKNFSSNSTWVIVLSVGLFAIACQPLSNEKIVFIAPQSGG